MPFYKGIFFILVSHRRQCNSSWKGESFMWVLPMDGLLLHISCVLASWFCVCLRPDQLEPWHAEEPQQVAEELDWEKKDDESINGI
jgi:hypothetical protein